MSSKRSSSKFTFPLDISDERNTFTDSGDKVMVISFIGKSDEAAKGCKAAYADELIGREVFQSHHPPSLDKKTLVEIEGYYDVSSHVIYLHLRSMLDSYHLLQALKDEKDESRKNFHIRHAEHNFQNARALLFLFSMSHIIILCHPVTVFNSLYVQMFRVMEITRQKFAPMIAELLREIPGISKEWIGQLRPCTPRLLFLFNSCPNIMIDAKPNPDKKGPLANLMPLKKMEHSLEDSIYRQLRKQRIVTNTSINTLFAIPANQEFVFIKTDELSKMDEISSMVNSLVKLCQGNESPTSKASSFPEPSHDFKTFLLKHVDVAFLKGFNDSVGRHSLSAHFELPTAQQWSLVAKKLYIFFISDPTGPRQKQIMSQLQSSFDSSIRFSEARCKKVLPLAQAAYQDNLPAHYTRTYHERKMAHAVSVFIQHARGPACQKYILQLEQECEKYWKNGKQMCEVLSLTGNPCTNPLHKAVDEEEPCKEALTWDRAPTMPHSSGVRYISACNCGRKQGPREDPFVIRTANCDFYAMLATDCCENLESRNFPVFQPSVTDYRAARLFPTGSRRESLRAESISQSYTQHGLSLGNFYSGHSGGSEVGTEEKMCSSAAVAASSVQTVTKPKCVQSQQEIIIKVTDTCKDLNKEKNLMRQPSTTEYLPGMPHTKSPPGLLPQFPSWSLICLGPSSLYSHNHGLHDQPGFLPGTGYLLPWDVTVKLEQHEKKWPLIGDMPASIPRKQINLKGRKSKMGLDQSEFVVKIFIGKEYECPRGHRFMCSAPDRVLKATVSGMVKDTGVKVSSSDMPLYFPCPCRGSKAMIAQLMRIHVVTPKARVFVTLNPKVQAAPDPCPVFVPGLSEPIKLSQSAYWILRLPYIYSGENGAYSPPKEAVPLSYARLLGGCYGIVHY